MVRRRQTQVTIAQVVLFGLVVPEVEQLIVAWLREVARALDDDDLVDGVLAILRRRWPPRRRNSRIVVASVRDTTGRPPACHGRDRGAIRGRRPATGTSASPPDRRKHPPSPWGD
jgi:hypothetical protein